MSDGDRITKMIEFLTAGGLVPHDHVWIKNILVVAKPNMLIPRKKTTEIGQYTRRELIAWHRAAEALQTKAPEFDIDFCLWETAPR